MWHLQVTNSSAIEQKKNKQTSEQQRKVIRSQGSREYRSLSAPPVGRRAGSGAAWCISSQWWEQVWHPCSPFCFRGWLLLCFSLLPCTLRSLCIEGSGAECSQRKVYVCVCGGFTQLCPFCLKAEGSQSTYKFSGRSCDSSHVLNMYRVYLVFPIGMTDLRVWQ